jgi:predicted nucleotidyltransferase
MDYSTCSCRDQKVLGDLLFGTYLHGSLATGDFDPLRSDIDFVVDDMSERFVFVRYTMDRLSFPRSTSAE